MPCMECGGNHAGSPCPAFGGPTQVKPIEDSFFKDYWTSIRYKCGDCNSEFNFASRVKYKSYCPFCGREMKGENKKKEV